MTTLQPSVRRCTVYHGHGQPYVQSMELGRTEEPPPHEPTIADRVPVSRVMSRDLVCARPDLDAAAVVALMLENHVGCIPVVDQRRRPIGVITKLDLVEQIEALLRSLRDGCPMPGELAARTAEELMLPLAITLGENATVAHAAAMMTCEDLHHVLVVGASGEIVGVVSSKDVVNWLVKNDELLGRTHDHPVAHWRPYFDE
jgi:CBS-domain-containing membrane protein